MSRPGRVSLKRLPCMHFYLKLANRNHIGILDVLLTLIFFWDNIHPFTTIGIVRAPKQANIYVVTRRAVYPDKTPATYGRFLIQLIC